MRAWTTLIPVRWRVISRIQGSKQTINVTGEWLASLVCPKGGCLSPPQLWRSFQSCRNSATWSFQLLPHSLFAMHPHSLILPLWSLRKPRPALWWSQGFLRNYFCGQLQEDREESVIWLTCKAIQNFGCYLGKTPFVLSDESAAS